MAPAGTRRAGPRDDGKGVIVFLKAPRPRAVKTRLAASLGDHAAVRLYRRFVRDTLGTLAAVGGPVIICHAPPDARAELADWIGDGYRFMPQRGADLGRRMADAFERAFLDGFEGLLLMGTDIPDLPPRIIEEGLAALDREGIVLGPAMDGGYYLVGFLRETFFPRIFEGIPWSTPRVLETTLERLKEDGREVHLLPVWRDIDREADLRGFPMDPAPDRPTAPETVALLRELGLPRRDGCRKRVPAHGALPFPGGPSSTAGAARDPSIKITPAIERPPGLVEPRWPHAPTTKGEKERKSGTWPMKRTSKSMP